MGVVDFRFLQKCHVNDSLVHTWHTCIILQSTLHAVQCILSGTKDARTGIGLQPTSTACMVLTPDASHHGQVKPKPAAAPKTKYPLIQAYSTLAVRMHPPSDASAGKDLLYQSCGFELVETATSQESKHGSQKGERHQVILDCHAIQLI
ncbi:hypothetical protein V8C34DRAFT_180538 [Trichoderma compactum]